MRTARLFLLAGALAVSTVVEPGAAETLGAPETCTNHFRSCHASGVRSNRVMPPRKAAGMCVIATYGAVFRQVALTARAAIREVRDPRSGEQRCPPASQIDPGPLIP